MLAEATIRILLVEDNPDHADLIRETLAEQPQPLEIEHVLDFEAFRERLDRGGIDVVISDFVLPTLDGVNVARYVAEHYDDVPVIVVSGVAPPARAVELVQAGAYDYIPKSDLSRLSTALRRVALKLDVRRRQEATQQALVESEQRFQQLMDNMDDVFFIAEEGSRKVEYVSPAYRELVGRDPASLEGAAGDDVFRDVHPEDVAKLAEATADLPPGGVEVTHRVLRTDGDVRWVRSRMFWMAERDEVRRFGGLSEDITDRLAMEEQMRSALRMEAVGRLAGGIAHDFNNILTVVQSYAQFLCDELPEGDLRADAGAIAKAADRATLLTRQLLAFSRRQIVQMVDLDLNQMIGEMDLLVDRLIGENVRVSFDLAPGLWPVKADRSQLEQVLMNLIVNAQDAMPEGGDVVVETRNVELDEAAAKQRTWGLSGRYVQLAVRDTGTGVPAEIRERIFEPFFSTKEGGKGTGFGLAMAYGIVKQHGGNIWLTSEPGQGARFEIYLPRAKPARTAKAVPAAAGPATILLVEDDAGVGRVTQRILQKAGYEVLYAESGRDAVDMAEEHGGGIDLMLTDVVMPNMSGRELADRMALERPGMAVVFMSGYTDDDIVRHGVLDADIPFVQKPFTSDELLGRIAEALNR